jgi:hypothetical protein
MLSILGLDVNIMVRYCMYTITDVARTCQFIYSDTVYLLCAIDALISLLFFLPYLISLLLLTLSDVTGYLERYI